MRGVVAALVLGAVAGGTGAVVVSRLVQAEDVQVRLDAVPAGLDAAHVQLTTLVGELRAVPHETRTLLRGARAPTGDRASAASGQEAGAAPARAPAAGKATGDCVAATSGPQSSSGPRRTSRSRWPRCRRGRRRGRPDTPRRVPDEPELGGRGGGRAPRAARRGLRDRRAAR
jgi:hypothetical protein